MLQIEEMTRLKIRKHKIEIGESVSMMSDV